MQSPTTNITYGGIEDSGLTVKVKDSSNPKIKWQVWKKDKDTGEENEVYSAIKKMEFGEVFGVSYGEKENSFIGKDGNNVTYTQRTIYSILPQVATTAQIPSNGANSAIQSRSNDDFGRRLAVHGMINGMLAAGVKPEDIVAQTIREVIKLEDRIDLALKPSVMDYDKVFNKEPLPEELPVIQQSSDENINVDDIPF